MKKIHENPAGLGNHPQLRSSTLFNFYKNLTSWWIPTYWRQGIWESRKWNKKRYICKHLHMTTLSYFPLYFRNILILRVYGWFRGSERLPMFAYINLNACLSIANSMISPTKCCFKIFKKYNFLLFPYIHWSMENMPEATTSRKNDSPSSSLSSVLLYTMGVLKILCLYNFQIDN